MHKIPTHPESANCHQGHKEVPVFTESVISILVFGKLPWGMLRTLLMIGNIVGAN